MLDRIIFPLFLAIKGEDINCNLWNQRNMHEELDIKRVVHRFTPMTTRKNEKGCFFLFYFFWLACQLSQHNAKHNPNLETPSTNPPVQLFYPIMPLRKSVFPQGSPAASLSSPEPRSSELEPRSPERSSSEHRSSTGGPLPQSTPQSKSTKLRLDILSRLEVMKKKENEDNDNDDSYLDALAGEDSDSYSSQPQSPLGSESENSGTGSGRWSEGRNKRKKGTAGHGSGSSSTFDSLDGLFVDDFKMINQQFAFGCCVSMLFQDKELEAEYFDICFDNRRTSWIKSLHGTACIWLVMLVAQIDNARHEKHPFFPDPPLNRLNLGVFMLAVHILARLASTPALLERLERSRNWNMSW